MPTYNPKKPPGKYPAAFHEALRKPLGGEPFAEYRTFYKVFPANVRRLRVSQELSGLKASLRKYPLHELHYAPDLTATRVEWRDSEDCAEDGSPLIEAVIVSWKVFKSSTLLAGLL